MSGITSSVTVRVGPAYWSMPAAVVRELVPAVLVQPHDQCPQQVLGLMDHRGAAVPVLCPSAVFEGAAPGLRASQHIIIVQDQRRRLGLPVDELVLDLKDVELSAPLDISRLFTETPEDAVQPWGAQAWQQLQARLQHAGGHAPLLTRARAVSTPKAGPDSGRPRAARMRLRAGAHAYSLSLDLVWETVHLPTLTQVPGSPPRVAGVCHYRGRILTVVDLPSYLGHDSAPLTPQTRALIVGRDAPEVALMIDGVPTVAQDALTPGEGAPTPLDVGALLADGDLYATRREAQPPQES